MGTAWLHGDAGQDVFCFSITPSQAAPDVIADFTPGQDRIGLAFSLYAVIDSAAPALADLPARVMVDRPDRLVFELAWLTTRPWGQELLDYRITYDQVSGVLSLATLPGTPDQPVCRLRGAPDLTPEDFAVILETL